MITCGSLELSPEPLFGPRLAVEVCMPLYEFLCEECDKTFSKVLTLADYNEEKITCPYCGGKKVVQEPSTFFAVTSKKS